MSWFIDNTVFVIATNIFVTLDVYFASADLRQGFCRCSLDFAQLHVDRGPSVVQSGSLQNNSRASH